MVQVIENGTEVDAVIHSRRPHPTSPDHEILDVTVTAARPVSGVRDLLSGRAGQRLDLLVPTSRLPQGELAGYRLTGRVSVAGPDVIRLHATEPSDLTVDPPTG